VKRQPDITGRVILGKPGPWGQLEYVRIATEMPSEFAFIISSDTTPQPWFFKGSSKEEVVTTLKSAGLSEAQVSSLMRTNTFEVTPEGCRIKASDELVLEMNENTRRAIYLKLARFTENKPQRTAFSFRPELLNDRLKASGLSPESIKLFRSLLYTQGRFLLFADLAHVLPRLANDEEKRRLIKMISRKLTMLVKLYVNPASDIEQLVNYWGTGGRAKDLKPLLESLVNTPGASSIDIVHLLPPFARRRLYTYPTISANATTAIQDCNWSTMNFFNLEPDDRFGNLEFISKTLQSDYYQIAEPGHLGDLVFLTLPSGESVHSAVYIADNLVFTKNGEAVSQPWILMKLDDLMELYSAPYPSDEPLRTLFYRQKKM
jgi:hypothetical protein